MTAVSLTSAASTFPLRSGSSIPAVGLGVYKATGSEAYQAVLWALRSSYRHVDSARMYGNEADVGKAVRDSGVPRNEVFITTKVHSSDFDRISDAVQESVKRFGGPVDLYLLHDPNGGPAKRAQAWRALVQSQKEGHTRLIGVSNFGIRHLRELEEAGLPIPDINQVELHPWCQQKEVVSYCQKAGIVVEAYCPIVRAEAEKFNNAVIRELGAKHAKGPAQILVRWSLQKGFVPLPKSAKRERIEENANVFDFMLDEDDMRKLDSLDGGDDGAISWNPIHVD